MAFLSKSCVYGIRASIFVALEEDKTRYIPISEISEALGISGHFLTKILQVLTQKGILTSYRGPKGGVKLKKTAEEVKLIEIVEAIDTLKIFEECILGLDGCGHFTPCPLHDEWRKSREKVARNFREQSLFELANNSKDIGFRLANL